MRLKSYDLGLVLVMAVVAAAFNLGGAQNEIARGLSSILLVLLLPGYALTEAVFAAKKVSLAERIVFSLGLSMAITIVGGLLLNLMPPGLQSSSWAILLSVVTAVASIVAFLRRKNAPSISAEKPTNGIRLHQAALFGLALVVAVGAIGLAVKDASEDAGTRFTQLWILPAANSNPNTIRLGVHNFEAISMSYALRVSVGDRVLAEWNSISLAAGQSWETNIAAPTAAESHTVQAQLYRLDAPLTPYRHVTLWLRP